MKGHDLIERLMVSGIVTIRTRGGYFPFLAELMVKGYVPGARILYLHWVDYHKRYWTLDYDLLMAIAKENEVGEEIADAIHFVRAFSKDNNRIPENWESIFDFDNVNLAILDSVSELYEESDGSMTYAIGKFVQFCVRRRCTGIIIDRGKGRIHNYLAHISSVILEVDDEIRILKHPLRAETSIPRDGQYKLVRWC
jgi:hypothetical protein